MSTITREQLITHAQENVAKWRDAMQHNVNAKYAEIRLRLAEIALASLEANQIYQLWDEGFYDTDKDTYEAVVSSGARGRVVYAAPPAPVSVPEWTNEQCLEFLSIAFRHAEIKGDLELDDIRLGVKMVNGSRAAMLQGAEKSESRCTIQPTPALDSLPKNAESPSGNSPVIPDGWVMVPVEPTDDMIVNGFESEPDESFSDEKEWEAYDAMSGCQQAAHRAKLCWAAMIKAAPKLE